MMEVLKENEYAKYWIEDSIVIESLKPEVITVTLPMVERMRADYNTLVNGEKRAIILEANKANYITRDARAYWAALENYEFVSIAAVYVKSYQSWLAAKLFFSMVSSKVKIEVFKNKENAIAWCKEEGNIAVA